MRFFLIFLLLPLRLLSQDLEGVWVGTIYNDTTHKYIPYEIAITESKGKISGYSHIVFMDNDKEVTGVKTVKIKKKNGKILIEDDELIYNNYIEPPAKGIKKYCVLTFTSGASGEYLIGAFNTNKTKEYASATGTINLKKKEKTDETKIIPKLEELNLSNSLSFIHAKNDEKNAVAILPSAPKEKQSSAQPITQQKDVAINLPTTKKESVVKIEKDENLIDINEDTVDYKVDVIPTEGVNSSKKIKTKEAVKTPVITIKKTDTTVVPKKQIAIVPEIKKPPVIEPKKVVVILPKEEKKQLLPPQVKETTTTVLVQKPVNKPEVISQANAKENSKTNVTIKKPDSVSVPKEKNKEPIMTRVFKPVQNSIITSPVISAAELAKRKIETIRSVDFRSDSLVLTLYDNGVVDGDTVSVILNGKVIMSKQRLTETALSKTIYITPELGDSLQLIMYAENLGSIAPNTGLLIIKDGEDSYQIRFAGDLQKNSAILLRRKHN